MPTRWRLAFAASVATELSVLEKPENIVSKKNHQCCAPVGLVFAGDQTPNGLASSGMPGHPALPGSLDIMLREAPHPAGLIVRRSRPLPMLQARAPPWRRRFDLYAKTAGHGLRAGVL